MAEEEACDEEAMCYLCLDVGVDKSDQSLRRDCACRGTDAGFVHLSCLTNYAETKSKQARDMNECIKPWRECPSCHQKYQNELAVDIATEVSIHVTIQKCKWKLCILSCIHSIPCLSVCTQCKRENLE